MGINTTASFGTPISPRSVTIQNNANQPFFVQTGGISISSNTPGIPGVTALGVGGAIDWSLRPGQWSLIPAGNYMVLAGLYSNVQVWDNAQYRWRGLSPYDVAMPLTIASDGNNFRVCNTTGTNVGAVVTNAGSGFTNGFYGYNQAGQAVTIQNGVTTLGNTYLTAAPPSGSSTFNVFVGGGITAIATPSSTATSTSYGGSGYTQAPQVIIAPSNGNNGQPYIPATATCVISGGQVGAITVINQGAGYVGTPTITFVNAPGDTTGNGAFLSSNSTNFTVSSGGVTAVTVASPATVTTSGNGITAGGSITFSGTATIGSLAAAVVPNLSILAVATIASAGNGYGTSQPVAYSTTGGAYGGAAAALTNPAIEANLIPSFSMARVTGSCAAGGTITTIPTVNYGGFGYSSAPTLVAYPSGAATLLSGVTLATFTLTMGGQTDTIQIVPI